MKKLVFGMLFLGIMIAGCSARNDSASVNNESTTSSTVKYEKKDLTTSDVDKVKIGDDLTDVYQTLGEPLREWTDDFVYEELDDAVSRDELIVSFAKDSHEDLYETHSELVKAGNKAKNINKLTMLQYTYTGESGDGTMLIWISPKTEKIVYFNQRSFIDENGEQPESSSNTTSTAENETSSISYELGDTIPFSSESGSSINVTIQSVTKDYGNDWYTPEGLYYAKVDFLVENTGTSPFDVNSQYLEFYDSNDIKSDLATRDYFSETIQAGKSAQGTAYFEVKNDGDNFEIFFADTSWKGNYQ